MVIPILLKWQAQLQTPAIVIVNSTKEDHTPWENIVIGEKKSLHKKM